MADGFVGGGGVGCGDHGGIGGGGFGRRWMGMVVELAVVDGSRGTRGGVGGVAVSGAAAAHGGPSLGTWRPVKE